MKIISWNCNMAFRNKYSHIISLKPDLIIIQECENEEKLKLAFDKIDYNQILWFGDNPNKGIAVISFQDYTMELRDDYNSNFKYIIPLSLKINSIKVNLFAIWAMPHKSKKSKSYIGQIWEAIHYYSKELNNPSILIGDFNSHIRWDSKRSPGNHTGVVAFLESKHIVSCYHSFQNIDQGEESDPTWFMYKHEDKPYHLDYCFVSTSLSDSMKCNIGKYENWIDLSDHMPLQIELHI